MNAIETLNRLKALDIAIFKSNGDLKIKAPSNRISQDLLEDVRKNKEELLRLLSTISGGSTQPTVIAPQADYPVSDQQRAIWILSQDDRANLAYNMPLVLKLDSTIDLTVLKMACQALVEQHESLRTQFFKDRNGEIRQQITAVQPTLSQVQINHISEEVLERWIKQEGMTPFQLDTAPLIRFRFLETGQGPGYLLITMHHLVCDGLSLGILQKDLFTAYKNLQNNQSAFANPPQLTYKDYTAWTIENTNNGTWQDQLEYWKKQLQGDLPKLRLNSVTRPLVKTFRGERLSIELSTSFKQQLELFCQKEKVSLFTGILAGLNILLHKYSGEKDLVLGTATSGRNHVAWEQQVGMFINTLALRTLIDETLSFREQVAQQKKIVNDALAHQDISFAEVVKALDVKRDYSRSLLFDFMLIFNDWRRTAQEEQGIEGIQVIPKDLRQTSQYDMVISFNYGADERLVVNVEFNSDLYSETFIQHLFHHYETLVSALLQKADEAIYLTDWISLQEQKLVLENFNDTRIEHSNREATLISLFKKQVKEKGNHPAISFKDRSYSFAEIDRYSDQLGHFLAKEFDCSLEAIIGVELEKSEWMMIAILAIQKLGCAYLPIDPAYPQKRKAYIAENSQMIGCLDKGLLTRFLEEKDRNDQVLNIHPELSPDHLAYVIYTSGSTGQPKGCMLTHDGVVNRIEWMWSALAYDASDVILQKTTFTFDVSVWEIFMPLCWGCQMVICEEEDIRVPSRITALIKAHQVTCLHFVPSMLDAYISSELSHKNIQQDLASLKRVITSGEALKPHTLRNWYAQLNVGIYNLYGPTEASIDVTLYDTQQYVAGPVPIGRPVANTRIYILDKAGKLLPPGINGELYLSGIQIARGYLNNEALTNERFLPDPFDPGKRMYKTGDLGRWLPDGNIAFVKRMDHQVKIRGFRVELGEIEHAMNDLEGINSVVVQVWEDTRGNKQLVAYFIGAETNDLAKLKAALKQKLPDYMIPLYWIRLNEFPLTSSGKVNRKALPQPTTEEISTEFESPQTATEKQIAEIFQEMLDLKRVDRQQSFFEMGGDSISVIELLAQLKTRFLAPLSVSDLYQYSSVAAIAELLSTSVKEEQRTDRHASLYKEWQEWQNNAFDDERHLEATYPMTAIQKGMVFGALAAEAQGVYHDQFVYPLHFPDFDLSRFRKAIKLLVEKHEILRTAFHFSDDGQMMQLLNKTVSVDIPFEDLSHLGIEEQRQWVQGFLQSERKQPFDFASAPLWRINLFRQSEQDVVYVLQFHHSILDGWSVAMFNREIYDLYEQLATDPDHVPQPLSCTPQLATAEATLEDLDEQQKGFWVDYLNDYKRFDLFEATSKKEVLHHRYSSEVVEQLEHLAKREKITVKSLFFTAFSFALQMLNQEQELTLGLVSNTRPLVAEGNKLLGCFLNTIPVRLQFPNKTQTWRELLGRVDQQLAMMKNYDRLPLLTIKELLGDSSRNGNPFFDILFNFINFRVYQNQEQDLLEWYEADEEQKIESHELTNSALVLDVNTTGGQLNLTYTLSKEIKYNIALKELHHYVDRAIQCLLTRMDKTAKSDDLLPLTQSHQLLQSFALPDQEQIFESTTVLDLLQEQVKALPNQVALESADQKLTYQDLEEWSNELALELLEQGVGKGSVVAICMERTPALVLSILSVLKSGAAYLPIDPKYPTDRIAYMLEQSDSQLIISHSKVQQKEWTAIVPNSLCIDQFKMKPSTRNAAQILPLLKADDIAYLMYTSGSTGRPKGIQVSHGALNNYINYAKQTYLQDTNGKGMGLYSSISFDLTVTSLFTPLASGKTLCLFPSIWEVDELLSAYLDRSSGLEVIKMTPSHIDLIPALDLPSSAIKKVIVGGEQLQMRHLQILKKLNKDIVVYNEYGPTESTVGCIVAELSTTVQSIPIGRPIVNTSAYILNANKGLVPVGVPGELYLGGAQLAEGYYKNTTSTASRFVPHPYVQDDITKLYRTGDLAVWLPDGNMLYLGRVDDQVKVRGHRVELGEIEQVMSNLPGIDQALVLLHTQEHQQNLVAYYTSEKQVSIASLRTALRKVLPGYMVPNHWIQLDAFPLTVNGKVAKDQLPDPEEATWSNETDYVAPRTDQEQILVQSFQQVLGRDQLSVKDHFFDLGGDSIKAILLINQVKKRGYVLKVSEVLRFPVLEEMALHLTLQQQALDQKTVTGEIALSPIQQWMFQQALEPNHFNQSIVLNSNQSIDPDLLHQSLAILTEHHDALRMRFMKVEDQWHQYNEDLGEGYFTFDYYDFKEKNGQKKRDQQIDVLQASFDIQQGPLLKAALFQLPQEAQLFLVAHHLIMDGLSWRILVEDLSRIYEQLSQQKVVDLPLKSHSFQHWLEVQTAFVKTPEATVDLTYWKKLEEKAQLIEPVVGLSKTMEYSIANQEDLLIEFDATTTQQLLKEAHRSFGTEINDLLLAALGQAAYHVFDKKQITLWLEGHGREELQPNLDLNRTVGWMTSLYPVLLPLHQGELALEYLIATKEMLRAIPHKGATYGMFRYLSAESNLQGVNASFNFNYLGDFGAAADLSNSDQLFTYSSGYRGQEMANSFLLDAPLSMTGMIIDHQLRFYLGFDKQHFDQVIVQRFAKAYQDALESLVNTLCQQKQKQLTPSDLTYKQLSRAELQDLQKHGAIEDVYPLAPLQEGMYYHWMLNPKGTTYLEQTSYQVEGSLQQNYLEQSYQFLLTRHAMLRTCFSHEYGKVNLQIVRSAASVQFTFVDASKEANVNQFVSEYKQRKYKEAFDLNLSPPMNLVVIQTGPTAFEFIWTYHHILMDGWCASILISEFASIYQAFAQGREPQLPAVRPYVDYINWLGQLDHQDSVAYWKKQLSERSEVSSIPYAKATLSEKTDYHLRQVNLKIDRSTYQKIKAQCRTLGITEYTFLKGSWAFLLSAYNNSRDVVFGNVVSGRPTDLAGVERMIGLFINMIPVRVTHQANDTVGDFLQGIHQQYIESIPYHHVKLSEIQAETTLKNELFDHGFVYLNYPRDLGFSKQENYEKEQQAIKMLGLDITSQPNYDFNIIVAPIEDTVEVSFWYNGHTYLDVDVGSIGEHYQNVINGFSQGTDTALVEVEYLSDEERQILLYQFNDTQRAFPKNQTVLSVFDQQVKVQSDAYALVQEDQKLTYAELDEASNQLAHYLLNLGLQAGQAVPICLERSTQLIISQLAIVKAGGIYVPIDPAYPKERIQYILEDSQSRLVITNTNYQENFNEENEVVLLDRDLDLIKQSSNRSPKWREQVDATSPLYIIYTSGSTGQPKGVKVAHRSVVNLIDWHIERYDVQAACRSTVMAGVGFDASALEIWSGLLSGSCLYIINDEMRLDQEALLRFYENNAITHAFVPPALIPDLVALPQPSDLALQYILIGGDRLPGIDTSKITYSLVNQYGPTEATVMVTDHIIPPQETPEHAPPIGRPIANTKLYILDLNQNLAAIGVPGELYIGGQALALGYHNKARETANRFVANPFEKETTSKLYRTGDIVRWLPNGNIEYIGRADQQVKIRGHRIELGEVEQVLHQIDEIANAIVSVYEEDHHARLIAYFTSESAFPVAQLREELKERLPEYMVPTYLIQLEKFPLTPNGKVDRKRLPDPKALGLNRAITFVAPKTTEEQILATAYGEVLKWEQVGANDNFFDLGGDSIKAILLINRLKQRGYTVKAGDILKHPVIVELAPYLKQDKRMVSQEAVSGAVALAPIQRWFFETATTHHHYNQSVLLKSPSRVDEAALFKVWEMLTIHHDALRMRFKEQDGQWSQYNEPVNGKHFGWTVHDFSTLEDWSIAYQKCCDDLQRSLDISQGPLCKVALFRLPEEDRILMLIHHLVVDGVSWRILLEDLSNLYHQIQNNQKMALAPKTNAYQLWANTQKDFFTDETVPSDLGYWLEVENLAKNVLPLPTKEHIEHRQLKDCQHHDFELDESLSQKITSQIHRRFNTEINEVLLAALGQSIYTTFGNEQIVVQLEGHGREDFPVDLDIGRTVGWFTSIYPVILPPRGRFSNSQYLVEIKEYLRAIPHKGISYQQLSYLPTKVQLKGTRAAVTFNYLGDFGGASENREQQQWFSFSDAYRGEEFSPDYSMDTALSITGWLLNGQMHFSIAYHQAEFDAAQISELGNQFQEAINALVNDLSARKEQELTPSDLTYKGLTKMDMQTISRWGQMEDVYPMSPLQEGIYYHWLMHPNSAVYVNQTAYTINARLEPALVEESYRLLIQHYTVLRTRFTHEFDGTHLQVVLKEGKLRFNYVDIQQHQNLEEYIEGQQIIDRNSGFDLLEATPMRLTVLRQKEEEYTFIWTHHHILMDGWCASLLINEFYRIYQALGKGETPYFTPKLDYRDYINWLGRIDQKASLGFWKNQLADFDTLTSIPFIDHQVAEEKYEGRVRTLKVEGTLFRQFRKVCQRFQLTESHLVQSCWAYLLSAYNHQENVVFGTVVSGRPGELEGVEKMVGLFINTIPVSIRCQKETSVQDFTRQVRTNAINSVPHHYLKLSDVQAQSDLNNELFDHVMVFENYFVQDKSAVVQDGDHQQMDITSIKTVVEEHYDFVLVVIPKKENLSFDFKYNATKLSDESINQMQQHFYNAFEGFINALMNDPKSSIGTLSYLTDTEQHQILHEFNQTAQRNFPSPNLLALIENQVRLHPNKIALKFDQELLTYAELEELSNQWANYLIGHYPFKNALVPVCMHRSIELVVVLLGLLKAGKAYVPIDPTYPDERICYILDEIGAALCITDQVLLKEKFKTLETMTACLEFSLDRIKGHSTERPNIETNEEQLAYMIYTSGSTGKPKGVAINHLNLTTYIHWALDNYIDGPEHRIGFFSPLSFDFTVTSLWGSLASGALLHIYPSSLDIDLILQHYLAKENGFTFIKLTPAHVQLIDALELDATGIKRVILGGEQLHVQQVQTLLRLNPEMEIFNEYGPTEATVGVSVAKIVGSTPDLIHIGQPIDNTEIYLLDPHGHLVPVGVKGELYIGGLQLAKGYYNQPALTEAAFVDHPFVPGERLYKTGDLGRWLPDGNICYLGRKDTQVKIRGYRIELGEIERVLMNHPQVDNAYVAIEQTDNNDPNVLAYVLCDKNIDSAELRKYVLEKLPSYMVPATFIVMEEFPLTVNGKIDRKQLLAHQVASAPRQAPETDLQLWLGELWKTVLGLEEIPGIHENFFELGGHSIKAIKMLSTVHKKHGVTVGIDAMFKMTTIFELARYIENISWFNSDTQESNEEIEQLEI